LLLKVISNSSLNLNSYSDLRTIIFELKTCSDLLIKENLKDINASLQQKANEQYKMFLTSIEKYIFQFLKMKLSKMKIKIISIFSYDMIEILNSINQTQDFDQLIKISKYRY
jgi:hypothetical protein